MKATDIGELLKARKWTRSRLVQEMRRVAAARNNVLPSDDSLKREIREWVHGRRGLSEWSAELLTGVFGVPFEVSERGKSTPDEAADATSELLARLDSGSRVDPETVSLFEEQTNVLRGLDRRLSAQAVLGQTELHTTTITGLMPYCLSGNVRASLAAAAAESAALAGWQALDVGNPDKAWKLHDVARQAARESENPSVLAHVTAQQAYALLDLERSKEALALIQHARSGAGKKVPLLLQSWLLAAEAEAHAACGDEESSRRAMDRATTFHPAVDNDPELPFIFLGESHLRRWRGHCLARLGASEAIDELTAALEKLDPTFTRAAAGLRCDLALAHSVRGDHELARSEAEAASHLATQTASVRQRRRINDLARSGRSDR